MLQNNLQYTLAKITLFNSNNNNKKEQNKEKRKKKRKDASKLQAKICIKDSNGSIFGNDVMSYTYQIMSCLLKLQLRT